MAQTKKKNIFGNQPSTPNQVSASLDPSVEDTELEEDDGVSTIYPSITQKDSVNLEELNTNLVLEVDELKSKIVMYLEELTVTRALAAKATQLSCDNISLTEAIKERDSKINELTTKLSTSPRLSTTVEYTQQPTVTTNTIQEAPSKPKHNYGRIGSEVLRNNGYTSWN